MSVVPFPLFSSIAEIDFFFKKVEEPVLNFKSVLTRFMGATSLVLHFPACTVKLISRQ